MRKISAAKNRSQAFTLVELLVVVAIISLLVLILLPALGKARDYARAVKSLSNTRQWGIGANLWSVENNDNLPWEGNKDDYMYHNFTSEKWWANAIPPMLGERSYRELSEEAVARGRSVCVPPDDGSIFIDPGAKFPYGDDQIKFYDSTNSYEYQLFFCYVWNSELNNGPTLSVLDDVEQLKLSSIRRAGETVLMLEMRTTNKELDRDDFEYYRTRSLLGRHRGDWKRLARRHLDGCHIVFTDCHAERVDYDWATTNRQGSRNPDYPGGDWNKTGLFWNCGGPSLK